MSLSVFKKIICCICCLAILLSSIVVTLISANATDVSLTSAELLSKLENYISQKGNNISDKGILDELKKYDENASVIDFYVEHAVDGVYDESNDSYPLEIKGNEGYCAVIVSVGGNEISTVVNIPHKEENLGELTADIYSPSNPNFTTSGSNITGYTGTAQKLVIPKEYCTGTISLSTSNKDNNVKAVILGQGSGEADLAVHIADNCFNGWTNLKAVVLPQKIKVSAGLGKMAFANCPSLKYLAFPHTIGATNSFNGTFGQGAFQHCTQLQNAQCVCGCEFLTGAKYEDNVFDNTAIRKFITPRLILNPNKAVPTTHSYTEGICVSINNTENKNATLTRAATMAQSAADTFNYKSTSTADEIKTAIVSGYSEKTLEKAVTADWGDTFQKENGVATGILTLSTTKNSIPITFYRNENAGLSELDVGYDLTPQFSEVQYDYAITVPFDAKSLQIDARAAYGAKILAINGNGDFSVDNVNTVTISTETCVGITVDYNITVTLMADAAVQKNSVKAAFEAYVEKEGNATTASGMLTYINNAISPMTVELLSDDEFFIYHAVDGVYDEDPVIEDRLSIPGHDGYVSAVLSIYENGSKISNVALLKSIPHKEENLGVLTKATFPDDFTVDSGNNITAYNGNAEKIVIPDTVNNINSLSAEDGVFKDAVVLIMKNKGTTVGNNAVKSFNLNPTGGYHKLKAVVFSDSTTIIGDAAFQYDSALKYVKLPSNMKGGYIDYHAFAYCNQLQNVKLPDYVNIRGRAFYQTAVYDFYEGVSTYYGYYEGERCNSSTSWHYTYGSPSFSAGTRVILTQTQQTTAGFARAAVLAQVAADGITTRVSEATENGIKRIIDNSFLSKNTNIFSDWNGTFIKQNDIMSGTLTLYSKDASIGISVYKNDNLAITGLTINDYKLVPQFDKGIKEYDLTVYNGCLRLVMDITLASGAKIDEIIGNNNFVVGQENIVTIKASSANGTAYEYKFSVNRLEPANLNDIAERINDAVEELVVSNSVSQNDIQKLADKAVQGESFEAEVVDYYKYKAINGAVENGSQVLVPGHKGYVTAVIHVSGQEGEKNIAVKKAIEPIMENYVFKTVSSESDFYLSPDGKKLLSYEGDAEKVVVPEGVEFMDDLWFYADTNTVKCIVLPDSLRQLPLAMCYAMRNLEVVTMGDNVVDVKDDTFRNCPSLKYVRLSENIPKLSNSMFSHTLSLAQLYIPQSVTQIRSNVFYRSLIRDVTLSKNITVIVDNAFSWVINKATSFAKPSLGSIVSEERAQYIQTEIVNKVAYDNGSNVPRTITVLNPDIELDYNIFCGDSSGAWAVNVVRAPEDSNFTEYFDEYPIDGEMGVAKKNYTYLNMGIAEAAARAQITADGMQIFSGTSADDVKSTICDSYYSLSNMGIEWVNELTTSQDNVKGNLSVSLEDVSFDIEIDTTIAKEVDKVIAAQNEWIDYDYKELDKNFDNYLIDDSTDDESYVSETEDTETKEETVPSQTTKRIKKRVKMRRASDTSTDSGLLGIPLVIWIIVAVVVCLVACGIIILIIVRKRKKATK